MLIGLHDSDKTNFPNYALMKISAWHKAHGDEVEWWTPLRQDYDKVYSSKVFTFTPENPYLPPNTIKGGQDTKIMIRFHRKWMICFRTTQSIQTVITLSVF